MHESGYGPTQTLDNAALMSADRAKADSLCSARVFLVRPTPDLRTYGDASAPGGGVQPQNGDKQEILGCQLW